MEYLIGVGLALAVCALARLVGFDRDRVFYPMPVTVIATYCILGRIQADGVAVPAAAPHDGRTPTAVLRTADSIPLAICLTDDEGPIGRAEQENYRHS
jgi:hypothetical protein